MTQLGPLRRESPGCNLGVPRALLRWLSGRGHLQAPSEAGRIHFLPAEGHPQLLSTWVSPAADFSQPANGIPEVTPHHFGDNSLVAASHSPTHTMWNGLSKGMNVRMRGSWGATVFVFVVPL